MTAIQPFETIVAGEMRVDIPDASPLPLKNTRVNVQILGPLASTAVTQFFQNPYQEPVELEYLFPLPKEAAVMGFEIKIGARTILGKIDETSHALEEYRQAVDEGRRAGLLEQRRPNLFAVRIGNILPGEDIQALFRYQQRLALNDDAFEYVFPMGLTPRYHSVEHPEEARGVDAPVASPGEEIGPVSVIVSLDSGQPIAEPTSPSHTLACTRLDENRFQVTLPETIIPDHDFVLRYRLQTDQVSLPAWATSDNSAGYFLAALVPPEMDENESLVQPREFIFVLDRSGSMMGDPIAQARNALRACLRILNPEDTFRILLFDDRLDWYQDGKSQAVEQSVVDQADTFLDGIGGRGGTEIIPALDAALTLPADPKRIRFILFLTDGAVSAENRALERVRKNLGQARMFTFGIGPSVNRALLQNLARFGRGAAEFLQLNEDIEGAIIRFQDRVTFPVLTDVSLSVEGAKVWDVYPSVLPDLYSGQPIEIIGRYSASGNQPIRILARGKRNRREIQIETSLAPAGTADLLIQRVWARARLDDLAEKESMGLIDSHRSRSESIALALEFQLASEYTSFVAIDQNPAVTGETSRKIAVSQPMPAGLDRAGFTGTRSGSLLSRLAAAAPFPTDAPTPASLSDLPRFLGRRSVSSGESFHSFTSDQDIHFSMALPVRSASEDFAVEPRPAESSMDLIRKLARSQRLDGSWNDDVETTAAALIAFVRKGHTTHQGDFRRPIRKAVNWLLANPGSGFAVFARALAFQELAQVTGLREHAAAAQSARDALPSAASIPEKTAWAKISGSSTGPFHTHQVRSLDELRVAGIARLPLPISSSLAAGDDLIFAWRANME